MAIIKCQICGRALESEESISRGVGSKCRDKYAYGIQAAGASFAQVEILESLNNSEVNKWLRVARLAIGKGRIRDARDFLEAAERAARWIAILAAEKAALSQAA